MLWATWALTVLTFLWVFVMVTYVGFRLVRGSERLDE